MVESFQVNPLNAENPTPDYGINIQLYYFDADSKFSTSDSFMDKSFCLQEPGLQRRDTINRSTECFFQDISVFSANDLLEKIVEDRGDQNYELCVCGTAIFGDDPLMNMLQDINLLEQTLEDRYLEIVVKSPQAEEDMFEERLFGGL
jgi:hypothetical protein